MFRNYFKTALRNFTRNKAHSFINLAGLSAGMAVALLIGLWIWDELRYDQYNPNYNSVAQVMQNNHFGGTIETWESHPYPLGEELRTHYGRDFKQVVMSSWSSAQMLTAGDKHLMKTGRYMEPGAPDILGLTMLKGSRNALADASDILLSASAAKAYFGDADPVGKNMRLNNTLPVKVSGVYADLPNNSSFAGTDYVASWQLYYNSEKWIGEMTNPWGSNAFLVLVQLADNVSPEAASRDIALAKRSKVKPDEAAKMQPQLFLHPLRNWHLRAGFKNGVYAGNGRIEEVWLFGIIGVFVLLLACINFMNLSTARSEKRAREVGIRKAIGSMRGQLVTQFFSESVLIALFAFAVALVLAWLGLPFFNTVAGKNITLPWQQPLFWAAGIVFSILTGVIAGSYPALYLSSFRPVKVLKGTFKAGRLAAVPRQTLVVLQFTVSVILIIGTIVVFKQIQYARNRPVGYTREGLISLQPATKNIHNHFEAVKTELLSSGAIVNMAEASCPVTEVWSTNGNISWKGKDPALSAEFPHAGVSYEYGSTVGWQFSQGRDFSNTYASDSSAFVINEAAAKFMNLQHPVGETIQWGDRPFIIIGVIKDLVAGSPYEPVRPSLYSIAKLHDEVINLKINPAMGLHTALEKIEKIYKAYNPDAPFEFHFVNEAFNRKFGNEERTGKLAGFFAALAVFISCLGLFGMASFMAEQRTREIGVRKVLGASVTNLWRLLSKDFVVLVLIALVIAIPVSYYCMHGWLQQYSYRSSLPWWIFAAAAAGALAITLFTVSFQAIKAALANPVKSLKQE